MTITMHTLQKKSGKMKWSSYVVTEIFGTSKTEETGICTLMWPMAYWK